MKCRYFKTLEVKAKRKRKLLIALRDSRYQAKFLFCKMKVNLSMFLKLLCQKTVISECNYNVIRM